MKSLTFRMGALVLPSQLMNVPSVSQWATDQRSSHDPYRCIKKPGRPGLSLREGFCD